MDNFCIECALLLKQFWKSKRWGSNKYFISTFNIKLILDYEEEKPSNELQEKRNEGANTYVYWVTDNLLNDWIQLPEV